MSDDKLPSDRFELLGEMSLDENHAIDEAHLAASAQAFERAIAGAPDARLVLRLYVSGMTARSRQAIQNIRELCDEHLKQGYDLEIIDIYQQPTLARDEQIIAVPTLVKKLPLPLRKIIGDMGDPGRIMVVLGIAPGSNA